MNLTLTALAVFAFAQDKIDWKTDYAEALKAAREAKKNLVLHFWATW